jgi:hypothetical protein
MAGVLRAGAAAVALSAAPALAGDRSDAGIDADDARTQAILGTPGSMAAGQRDSKSVDRPPRRSSHVRSHHAVPAPTNGH